MIEWCDLYSKCPYFYSECTTREVFDHDSFTTYCMKSGNKREIPHIACKSCSVMQEMLKEVEIENEKRDVTTNASLFKRR